MVGQRSAGMTLIAALSLLVGVTGLLGSATMISDGLGFSKVGRATSDPTLGSSAALPPGAASLGRRAATFGAVRLVLSLVIVVGAVGTLGVRPSGRKASLAYAVG